MPPCDVAGFIQSGPDWRYMRESIIEDFRRWQREGVARHVLVPRVHHDEIVDAAIHGTACQMLLASSKGARFIMSWMTWCAISARRY